MNVEKEFDAARKECFAAARKIKQNDVDGAVEELCSALERLQVVTIYSEGAVVSA